MPESYVLPIEPVEAFPYSGPTAEIKRKYRHIFELKKGLSPRFFKTLFDRFFWGFVPYGQPSSLSSP
jgi:hypothetical protein